jgi:RND family efflux transporter MFP subunit
MVKSLVVDAGTLPSGREYSGEVRARYEVPLSFRVAGKILERPVDTGQRVAAGRLLARLDAADLQLQLAQAKSQQGLALAEAARYRELRRQNFVSAAALDAKETALTAAEAQAGIAANQSAYARLTAERAGVVAAILAEPGQVVSAGQPVLRLALDGEREVAISLPESALAHVRVGMPVAVSLWSDGRRYQGRVRELSAAADPATRTFAARITILDIDAAAPLGMTASVLFPDQRQKAVVVPTSAIFQQGDRPAVWLVGADGTVALRPVVVGSLTDAGAVIAEGLTPGERIVAAGVHKLTPGQAVRIAP